MTFTGQEIEQDWLAGGYSLAIPLDKAVAAFNKVEATYGRSWVEASRENSGAVVRGTQPTLHMITLGLLLESLDGVSSSEQLLEKVRTNQPSAMAELIALYILRSAGLEISVELEPEITVGHRNRKPDFRIRSAAEPWTYVEVTQASRNSPLQKDVEHGLKRLTDLIRNCTASFALEVFFKREPSGEELDFVEQQIMSQCGSTGQRVVELPQGLGTLYWNQHPPGAMVIEDHGEPYTPRLGRMGTEVVGGEPYRQISVRWPFTDKRAEAMLADEAKQLPTEAPGIVMIQTSGAVGAMKAWRALIQRRLQPSMHTRVSAVCLFASANHASPAGEEWRPECKIIINPHARYPAPAWIIRQLERFPSSEADL